MSNDEGVELESKLGWREHFGTTQKQELSENEQIVGFYGKLSRNKNRIDSLGFIV